MVEETHKCSSDDPFELCLICRGSIDGDSDVGKYTCLLNESSRLPKQVRIEERKLDKKLTECKEEKPPQVELKPLSLTLKSKFLGPHSTYSIIINPNLNETEIEKLFRTLRLYRKVIGYVIDDIKRISPSTCMHKILLENEYKSSIKNIKEDQILT